MSKLRLASPSLKRAVVSVIAVAVVSCVISGIALAVSYTHGLSDPAPVSNYIRLFVTFVAVWGPMYLLFFGGPRFLFLSAWAHSSLRCDAQMACTGAARPPKSLRGRSEQRRVQLGGGERTADLMRDQSQLPTCSG